MKKQNRKMKNVYAMIWSIVAVLALNIGSVSASALDVSNILNFGNGLVAAIQSVAVIIAIGATIVLGIMLITAGRAWAEKLKSGSAGIVIGILLIALAATVVPGLFADAGGTGGAAGVAKTVVQFIK